MNNYFPLTPYFKIIVEPTPPHIIDPFIKDQIERLWDQELIRTNGKIFNGKLLSATSFQNDQLIGHFVEYKNYLAQARNPSLSKILNIQPICVCSYTVAGNDVLIGKRSDFVTDYRNFYELVPAGGIDPSSISNNTVDIIQQLKVELKEEAGILESMILNISPKHLIIYPETNSYEICSYVQIDPSIKNMKLARDEEYTELLWIPKHDLTQFVEKNRDKIIPLSLQLIDLF